ncbi:MAG: glutathione S-transferase family protein [Pseudomonadota bacterium]
MKKLYTHPLSVPAHRVEVLLNILGIEFDCEIVDLLRGEQHTDTFLRLNPLGQIPVFEEEGVLLRDSIAIMIYLCRRYDPKHRWLPDDPIRLARVHQWLSLAVHDMTQGPLALRAIEIFDLKEDRTKAERITTKLLSDVFEPRLSSRNWLVDNAPTIADLACCAPFSQLREARYELCQYQATSRWIRRVEAIDKFKPMVAANSLLRTAHVSRV